MSTLDVELEQLRNAMRDPFDVELERLRAENTQLKGEIERLRDQLSHYRTWAYAHFDRAYRW